jgi:nicotinate phosphoribosyltransferase
LWFADKAINHYQGLGIDPKTKTIVFSDSLNDQKAIEINEHCKDRIKTAFGIGTFLTNDCGYTPLNMVIKLAQVTLNGARTVNCVKLSDSPGKYTGDPQEVALCKSMLGLE